MHRKFALIAEGDVFMVLTINDEINPQQSERWVAGLNSNPVVVEFSAEEPIDIGWAYSNGEFTQPTE